MTLHVPAIDIAPFLSGDPDGKARVVDAVRAACRDIGFLVIAGQQDFGRFEPLVIGRPSVLGILQQAGGE